MHSILILIIETHLLLIPISALGTVNLANLPCSHTLKRTFVHSLGVTLILLLTLSALFYDKNMSYISKQWVCVSIIISLFLIHMACFCRMTIEFIVR